jgi:hypothetical protein
LRTGKLPIEIDHLPIQHGDFPQICEFTGGFNSFFCRGDRAK